MARRRTFVCRTTGRRVHSHRGRELVQIRGPRAVQQLREGEAWDDGGGRVWCGREAD